MHNLKKRLLPALTLLLAAGATLFLLLHERREIPTSFGETLSWDYLAYARRHPISWSVPTRILYGEKDNLTSYATISAFAQRIHAPLTVMSGGEHWFHTPEQMAFLDDWIRSSASITLTGRL